MPSPTLGIALSLTRIVLLNAYRVLLQVGPPAEAINGLRPHFADKVLCEQIGHGEIEIRPCRFVGGRSCECSAVQLTDRSAQRAPFSVSNQRE